MMQSMSERLSKRLSDGMEQDPRSPEILQELVDAESEWTGVSDIIHLSFKAACHVLKAQSDCIKEMEQVLPAKANKQDVNHQMSLKANLEDIQSTMAEIASNIESKVGMEEYHISLVDNVTRAELSLRLQEKVCFDDMKRYVTLNGGANAPSANGR